MLFLCFYLISYVPTLHTNDCRHGDIVVPSIFIPEFTTLYVKHYIAGKMPKSKDFYKFSLCSNTIVSTCSSLSKLILISSSMIGSLNLMDFNHCPLG